METEREVTQGKGVLENKRVSGGKSKNKKKHWKRRKGGSGTVCSATSKNLAPPTPPITHSPSSQPTPGRKRPPDVNELCELESDVVRNAACVWRESLREERKLTHSESKESECKDEECVPDQEEESKEDSEKREALSKLVSKELSEEQRKRFTDLLYEFRDQFVSDPRKIREARVPPTA